MSCKLKTACRNAQHISEQSKYDLCNLIHLAFWMDLCELVVLTLSGGDVNGLQNQSPQASPRKDDARALSSAIAVALETGMDRIRITGSYIVSERQEWKINVLIMPSKDPSDRTSSRALAKECRRQVSDPQSSFRQKPETARIIDAKILVDNEYKEEIALGKGSLFSMITACRWYYQTSFKHLISWHFRCIRIKFLTVAKKRLNFSLNWATLRRRINEWWLWARSRRRRNVAQSRISCKLARSRCTNVLRNMSYLVLQRRRLLYCTVQVLGIIDRAKFRSDLRQYACLTDRSLKNTVSTISRKHHSIDLISKCLAAWRRARHEGLRCRALRRKGVRAQLSFAFSSLAVQSAQRRRLLDSAFAVCRSRLARQLHQTWARWRTVTELSKVASWGIARVGALSASYSRCDPLHAWHLAVNSSGRADAALSERRLAPAELLSAELEAVRMSLDPGGEPARLVRWQRVALIGQRIQRRRLCNPIIAGLRRWSAAAQDARRLVHAEAVIARGRDRRRSLVAWSRLRIHSTRQQRAWLGIASARDRATAASIAQVLRAWAGFAGRGSASRHAASGHLRRTGLRRVRSFLLAWGHYHSRFQRLNALYERASLARAARTIWNILSAWRESSVQAMRTRRRCEHACSLLSEGRAGSAFDAWGLYCLQAAKERSESRASAAESSKAADTTRYRATVLAAACRRLSASHSRYTLATVLMVWSKRCERKRVLRRKLQSHILQYWQAGCARLLAAWVVSTTEARIAKARAARACVMARTAEWRMLHDQLQLWRSHSQTQGRLRRLCRKAAARLLHSRLASCWHFFHQRALETKRVRNYMQSIVMRWRGGLIAKALEIWACNAARMAEERAAALRAEASALKLASSAQEAEATRSARLRSIGKRILGRWLGMQLAVCLSHWLEMHKRKKRLHSASKVLTRKVSRSRLSYVLKCFKQQTWEQKSLRRLGRTAFAQFDGRRLERAWQSWCFHLNEIKSRVLLAKRAHMLEVKWVQHATRSFWIAWSLGLKRIRFLSTKSLQKIEHCASKSLSLVFQRLALYATVRRRLRNRGLRLQTVLVKRSLLKALNYWSCNTAMLAEKRAEDSRRQALVATSSDKEAQLDRRHCQHLEQLNHWIARCLMKHQFQVLVARWALVVVKSSLKCSSKFWLQHRALFKLRSKAFGAMKEQARYTRQLRTGRLAVVRQSMEGSARRSFSNWALRLAYRRASDRCKEQALRLEWTSRSKRMQTLIRAFASFTRMQHWRYVAHKRISRSHLLRLLLQKLTTLWVHMISHRKIRRHHFFSRRRLLTLMLNDWKSAASEQISHRLRHQATAQEKATADSQASSQVLRRERLVRSVCLRIGTEWFRRCASEAVLTWSKHTRRVVTLRRQLIFLLGKRCVGSLEGGMDRLKLYASLGRSYSTKGQRLADRASRNSLAGAYRRWSAWYASNYNASLRVHRSAVLRNMSRRRFARATLSAWSRFAVVRRCFGYCTSKICFLNNVRQLEVTMGRLLDLLYHRKQMRCTAARIHFRHRFMTLRQCLHDWSNELLVTTECRGHLAAMVMRAIKLHSVGESSERNYQRHFKCLSRMVWATTRKHKTRRLRVAFTEMRRSMLFSNFILRCLWHHYRRDCVKSLSKHFRRWLLTTRQLQKLLDLMRCTRTRSIAAFLEAWSCLLEQRNKSRSLNIRLDRVQALVCLQEMKAVLSKWRLSLRLSRALSNFTARGDVRSTSACFVTLRRYAARGMYIRVALERQQGKMTLSMLQHHLGVWTELTVCRRQKGGLSVLLLRRNSRAALHRALLAWQRANCSGKKETVLQSARLMDGEYALGKRRLVQRLGGLAKLILRRWRRASLAASYAALRWQAARGRWALRGLWHLFRRGCSRRLRRAVRAWGAHGRRRRLSARSHGLVARRSRAGSARAIFACWSELALSGRHGSLQALGSLPGAEGGAAVDVVRGSLASGPHGGAGSGGRGAAAGGQSTQGPDGLGGEARAEAAPDGGGGRTVRVEAHQDRKLSMLRDLNAALLRRMLAGGAPPPPPPPPPPGR